MAKTAVITEAMIEAAFKSLEKRIAEPPPPTIRTYTRKDAFLKLKECAKEALAAGHSLETVLEDLKGVGIGLSLSTARQYLKPGRKLKKQLVYTTGSRSANGKTAQISGEHAAQRKEPKGTFTVTEDETEI